MTHAALFLYLQLLDALTTVVFLRLGAQEGNPIASAIMQRWGLMTALSIKLLASICLVVICWRLDRMTIIRAANIFFAALVIWNLVIGILGGS